MAENFKSRLRDLNIGIIRTGHFIFSEAMTAVMRKAGLLPERVAHSGRTF